MINRCRKKICPRVDLVVFILSVLLAFTAGAIIGAFFAVIVLMNLASLIVFAIILIILLIIRIITRCCTDDCDNECKRC